MLIINKNNIVKIAHNAEFKVIVSNFAYLSILQIVGYIIPLFTLPYLARVLGVEGFGKIAFANAIVVWLQTIADWGFNFTSTRDVARYKHNRRVISYIFSIVLWSRMFLTIISFFILLSAIYLVTEFRENSNILLISFLLIPTHILFPDWFFQAIERMKFISIFSFISKLIFTISVFFFIKEADDYILQPLLICVGNFVAGCFSIIYIIRNIKIIIYPPSISRIITTIKSSTSVFLSNLLPNLYNSFSYVLLGAYTNQTNVGFYEAGRKLPTIIYNQFLFIVARVLYPYFSRNGKKNINTYFIFNITVSIFFTAVLFIFAPYLIRLFFGNDFQPAVIVLRITSLSIIFHAFNLVYVNNYMLTNKFDKAALLITLFSSLIGFGFSFPLINKYSYVGASISYLIATILLGILPFLFYIKNTKKDKDL